MIFQSYVVRMPHRNIRIDSCLGNDKNLPHVPDWNKRQGQGYELALEAAGLRFEDIDYVFCTHLHSDHVGWNTRLVDGKWAPTFPKARYVFSAHEVRFWKGAYARAEVTVFEETVLPGWRRGGRTWWRMTRRSATTYGCCRRRAHAASCGGPARERAG